jgi:hypothetical protein
MKPDIDDGMIWRSRIAVIPPGHEQVGGHKSREHHVIPATDDEYH